VSVVHFIRFVSECLVCHLYTTVLFYFVRVSMRILRAFDTFLFLLASAVYIFVPINDKCLFLFNNTSMREAT
jgi:hypothetical protein